MTDEKMRSKAIGRERLRTPSALAMLCFLAPALVAAEIFRYQDDAGNWHFTDAPPKNYESSVVPGIRTSKASAPNSAPTEDLASRLQSAFNPITPIAYATLAVVSIKTDGGEGSGFFCSENGHILTNMHLVRPAPAETGKKHEAATKEQSEKLQTLEAGLKKARNQLQLMKQDLTGYEELIENTRDTKTRAGAREEHERLSQRYREGQGKASAMDRRIRSIKTAQRDRERNLAIRRGPRQPKTRFDIVLKDGTELAATLVKISDTQDLALLKLDGYRTPFLRLDPSVSLSEGVRVFAIGNPLGMQAAVSSGVVTQIAPDHLYTDAQILPGSSGGPLIRESGEVIGISVARRVAAGTSKYAAGFGKAIRASLAVREFPQPLATVAGEDFRLLRPQTQDPYWGATFGATGAKDVGPVRDAGHSAGQGGDSGSEPVRLIIPGQDADHRTNEPAEQPTARSLDFPPEGAGIPPGISRP